MRRQMKRCYLETNLCYVLIDVVTDVRIFLYKWRWVDFGLLNIVRSPDEHIALQYINDYKLRTILLIADRFLLKLYLHCNWMPYCVFVASHVDSVCGRLII